MAEICSYSGLVGIITDVPDRTFLDDFSHEDLRKVVVHYSLGAKGVASAFWGHKDHLDYAMIVSMDSGVGYTPKYQKINGLFVPSLPLCGDNSNVSGSYDEDTLRKAAMRETLIQALDILDNPSQRKGRYFMLTPFEKGCCSFKGGTIKVSMPEIKQLLGK